VTSFWRTINEKRG